MGTETALDTLERGELEKQEKVIREGMQTFVEVGKALATIRDKKLYREEYKTFEKYCEQKWGFKRARAYQLIESAGIAAKVSTSGRQKQPTSERQTRPLKELPENERSEAWEEAQQEAGGKEPTGKQVEEVVARRRQPEPEPEPEPEAPQSPIDEALSRDGELKDILSSIDDARKKVKAVTDTDIAAFLNVKELQSDLKNARNEVRNARPHAECPLCGGEGCKACNDQGWMPKDHYQRAVESQS